MRTFQALWPIVDSTIPYEELKAEALADLPKVARRHGVITIGEPKVFVRLGNEIAGAGPAALVVIVESPVAEVPPTRIVDHKYARECDRCGVEKAVTHGVDEYFCKDCKRFVKADGWLEKAS